MRSYNVCLEQDEPEAFQESIVIIARDMTEAMVVGHDLIDVLREELTNKGVKAKDFENIRLSGINEEGLMMNEFSQVNGFSKEQVSTLAKIIKISIE